MGVRISTGSGRSGTELKDLVRQVSDSLAQLDAKRLEELAESYKALTKMPVTEREVRDALAEMAVLRRVLDVTHANVEVMHRLRTIRVGQTEYTEKQVGGGTESEYGND
jgi:hypothetical protein